MDPVFVTEDPMIFMGSLGISFHFSNIGDFFSFYVRYSTLLHLMPPDPTVSEDAGIEPRLLRHWRHWHWHFQTCPGRVVKILPY
jgi:hypothetical protein